MKNYQLFIKTLSDLIAFKTVQGAPSENAPFGIENKNALDYTLSLAKEFGFETINYNGYIGEVSFGNGEEIGIIGHLDVVPEGEGWDTDPYTLTIKDGYLYGRGVSDDKSPILLCLFALKELKDSNIVPNKKFRLFFGLNEENGWKDVDYLKTQTTLPKKGFSPDADFPVIYAEKGPSRIDFHLSIPKNLTDISTIGNAGNAVPNHAYIKAPIDKTLIEKYNLKINGDKIESFGKSAHGSKPHLGKNALKPLFEYLNELNGGNLKDLVDNFFNDAQKISQYGNETGYATFSPNLARIENGDLVISVDFRTPAKFKIEQFYPLFNNICSNYKLTRFRKPHFVNPNSNFVKTLVNAYNSIMKSDLKPVSCSGATFASVFEMGVAFGPEFIGSDNKIHEPNECMSEKELLLAYEIYKKALFDLAK